MSFSHSKLIGHVWYPMEGRYSAYSVHIFSNGTILPTDTCVKPWCSTGTGDLCLTRSYFIILIKEIKFFNTSIFNLGNKYWIEFLGSRKHKNFETKVNKHTLLSYWNYGKCILENNIRSQRQLLKNIKAAYGYTTYYTSWNIDNNINCRCLKKKIFIR